MNIFLHEWKSYQKSTIIWSLSLVAIIVLYMSMYSSFSKDAQYFMDILDNYPEAIRNAFGFNQNNFFTILGFYSFPLAFITLAAAIQAMNLGISIVSKEVRGKTADFLLTKPITRSQILTNKLLAALASILLTNIIYFIAASFMALQVKTDDFSMKIFFLLSLTIFFIQLIFLALGTVVSVIFQKIKSVISISLPTVFAFYFFSMFSNAGDDEVKRFISPFKYFDAPYIIKNSSYEAPYLIVSAIFIIVAVVASYIIFSKKDIRAV